LILVDVETVAVLRKRRTSATLCDQRFEAAVEDLEGLDIRRVPVLRLMRRAYELRANVTAHDASYVALAEVLDCEFLTPDETPRQDSWTPLRNPGDQVGHRAPA